MKELIKTVIGSIINDQKDAADSALHQYMTQKVRTVLGLHESDEGGAEDLEDKIEDLAQKLQEDSFGDGVYLCSAEPVTAERVDSMADKDYAKFWPEYLKAYEEKRLVSFATYTSGGGFEGAWVVGTVEKITPDSFDTYAFRAANGDYDDKEELDGYKQIVKDIEAAHGKPVAAAFKAASKEVNEICMNFAKVKGSGKWLLIVATDD